MTPKNVFFVVLLLLPCALAAKNSIRIQENVQDANSTLQAIQNRIQQTGAVSAYSLGDNNVWKYLWEAIVLGTEVYNEIQMYHIQFSLSNVNGNLELYVTGQADIWNQTNTQVTFVIYVGSGLELALQFGYNATLIPYQLWPANNKDWFSGLNLIGMSTVTVSTASFTDNKGNQFYQGLAMEAHAETNEKLPIQDSLYPLIHGSNTALPKARVPITGTLVAQFPLSTDEDLTHWTLTIDGTIYFSSPNVQSNNVVVDFQLTTSSADITLNTDLTITNLGGGGTQPVTFHITADVSTASFFTFNGVLEGEWTEAFGFKWMSFTSLDINFQFNPLNTPTVANLQFNGAMTLAFSSLDAPIQVTFDGDIGTDLQQIEIVAIVPVVDLEQLFNMVLAGNKPNQLSQVAVSGQVNFAFSTYNGQYQEGFTINGNIVVSKMGAISKAIKALNPNPTTWTYAFQLYVPVFSENPAAIDFYFTETGPIVLTRTLIMTGYHVEFDMTPENRVVLSTNVQWTRTLGVLNFMVSATVDENQSQTTLALVGTMQGTWVHPFGLTWLTLANVQISLTVTNGVPQAFSFQGTADVSFGSVADASITIIIPGPSFDDGFSFTIDMLIPNMQVFLDDITDPRRVPAITSEISLECQLSVSTFAHDNVVAGIMVSGNAMVSRTGHIANAILSVNPSNPLYFTVAISLPIFSDTPWDVSFEFSEKGTYQLKPNVVVNEFAVSFAIGDNPSVSMSADTIVKVARNPNPFHIIFSAALGGGAGLSLSGSLQGGWKPFDLSWFTATSATATLIFADLELQTFAIGGTCNITVLGNTAATFELSLSDDFFNSYIEIEALTIANLGDFIKALTGQQPPAWIAGLITVTNDFEFMLSTYTDGNIIEGLTLSDKVTVTGPLAKELNVFNQYGQVTSATYGMGLTLPVFPGQYPNIRIDLQTPSIQLKKNMLLTGVNFLLATDPVEFAVSTGLQVTFSNNPQLNFAVSGSFSPTGTISLGGGMLGTWDNMFGIQGVDISNVELAVGFNPSYCGIDFCLSAFGLGYNLTIGSKIVAFYGYINIPEIEDIFLEGQLVGPNGIALSLRDIASEWNALIGNALGIPINVNNIPADWGFFNTYFYIAPEAGNFNNLYYSQGFWIDGGFNMFGMEVLIDIQVTTQNFDFNVTIDTAKFQKNLQGCLVTSGKAGGSIVTVHDVTLTKMSTWNYGHGKDPVFWMDYTFLGRHQASINVPVVGLYGDFKSFFDNYLSKLFD